MTSADHPPLARHGSSTPHALRRTLHAHLGPWANFLRGVLIGLAISMVIWHLMG